MLWIMLRTAKQRKQLCKECPVARVADLLGDSCSLLILRDLLEKPRRFGELEESLSGISSRTLTNKLKFLTEEKLIEHTEHDGHAQYSLTNKGNALHKILDAMREYGKKYL